MNPIGESLDGGATILASAACALVVLSYGLNAAALSAIPSLAADKLIARMNLEQGQIDAIMDKNPSIALEIYFSSGSAILRPASLTTVDELGKALTSPALKGSSFLIAGHTDALESDDFSLNLSERRAIAVKSYLVEKYQVPAENLFTVGYGSNKLRDPKNPFSEQNRRVVVVNMTY